jgi:response regulator RpfG family c-di-GMP phosphodiesterase
MNMRVLFIDDDDNLLDAFQRQLRGRFEVDTAQGGQEGLDRVESAGPYAVVVSDLRMPGLDGIAVLSRVREMAPDTVRIMLTGHADLVAATAAVNEGNIFRLLTKPCQDAELKSALAAGLEQYRLVMAERELLEKTLRGAVDVLAQVLSLANPKAFGRSARIKSLVVETGRRLNYPRPWELETATLLSQVGYLILPDDVLVKLSAGDRLEATEADVFSLHPKLAFDLLSAIPRLEGVAEMVAYQEKRFDGKGVPPDSRQGQDIPLGSRILKVALDYDSLRTWGQVPELCLEKMRQRAGWYDPEVLEAFVLTVTRESGGRTAALDVAELKPRMIVAQDVRNDLGRVVVQKGTELTGPLVTHLRAFSKTGAIPTEVQVIVRP